MALLEGCKHSLEISVPVEEVETETGKVVSSIQAKAKLPGFRPGKAPASLIRKQFQGDIRQQVLENLIPRHLQKRVTEEELRLVGRPDVTKVKFEPGEPLEFTAEFEVSPEVELKEYKDLTVHYHEPDVTDDDIAQRIESIRERKAEYINVDPRPLEDGDTAVVSLVTVGGVEGDPVKQDEIMIELGAKDTVAGFTEGLRGASPGEDRDFDVVYPEDYGQEKLAGRTVKFHANIKGVRKKELPELNDEFAKDLGDYQSLEELQDMIRKTILAGAPVRSPAGSQEQAGRDAGRHARISDPGSLRRSPDSESAGADPAVAAGRRRRHQESEARLAEGQGNAAR